MSSKKDKDKKDKDDKKEDGKPSPRITQAAQPIFGIPLEEAARRTDELGAVPSPLRKAVEYLNKRGLSEEGLYRVPGSTERFQQYKAMFDSGVDVDFEQLDERSPENVAMVVVKYLQMLPEQLVTNKYEQHFRLALQLEAKDKGECYAVLRAILLRLPFAHRETIKFLAEHLRLVAANSHVNKMTARNIEITWSLSVGGVVGALMRLLVESNEPLPSTVVFGVPLAEALFNSETPDTPGPFMSPSPIAKCTEWLEKKKSYSNDSIFLSSLKLSPEVQEWKNKFNHGMAGEALPDDLDPSLVVSLLKLFVLELPESLFTKNLHSKFVRVSLEYRGVSLVKHLKELLWQLPEVNRNSLQALVMVLQEAGRYNADLDCITVGRSCFGKRYRDVLPLLIGLADLLFLPGNTVPIDAETIQSIAPACLSDYLTEEPISKSKTPDSTRHKKKSKTHESKHKRVHGAKKEESKTIGEEPAYRNDTSLDITRDKEKRDKEKDREKKKDREKEKKDKKDRDKEREKEKKKDKEKEKEKDREKDRDKKRDRDRDRDRERDKDRDKEKQKEREREKAKEKEKKEKEKDREKEMEKEKEKVNETDYTKDNEKESKAEKEKETEKNEEETEIEKQHEDKNQPKTEKEGEKEIETEKDNVMETEETEKEIEKDDEEKEIEKDNEKEIEKNNEEKDNEKDNQEENEADTENNTKKGTENANDSEKAEEDKKEGEKEKGEEEEKEERKEEDKLSLSEKENETASVNDKEAEAEAANNGEENEKDENENEPKNETHKIENENAKEENELRTDSVDENEKQREQESESVNEDEKHSAIEVDSSPRNTESTDSESKNKEEQSSPNINEEDENDNENENENEETSHEDDSSQS